jgi:dihydrofolate reductase
MINELRELHLGVPRPDTDSPGQANNYAPRLRAGFVDELHLDVIPVLLGGGLRLLENLDPDPVRSKHSAWRP